MRLLKKAGVCAVLTLVCALVLSVSALAADNEIAIGVGCTTGSSLRLRKAAGTSSGVLTYLDKFMPVAILEKLDNWYKISFDGRTGYVSADYMIVDKDNVFNAYGWSAGNAVNVRTDASLESDSISTLNAGDCVKITGFRDGWYSVVLEDETNGYVRSDFLNIRKTPRLSAVRLDATEKGASAIELARQYLGTRYVYGGASPKGFDCSGFTLYVLKQLGIVSLPHSATSQWQSGFGTQIYEIEDLQPGDLVFFNDPKRNAGKACSHTGFYAGDGQVLHASSSKSGVVLSDLTSGYYNRYFIGGIHY